MTEKIDDIQELENMITRETRRFTQDVIDAITMTIWSYRRNGVNPDDLEVVLMPPKIKRDKDMWVFQQEFDVRSKKGR